MAAFNEDILHRRWYVEAREVDSDVVYPREITDFTHEHYLNPDGSPTIGSTCAAIIKFTTNDTGPSFLNAVRDFYGGYGNEPRVYFKLGRFKITEVEQSVDGIKTVWQGYDAMIYAFEKEYVCRIPSERFPLEPRTILEEINEQTGIEINYDGLMDVYPVIGDGSTSPLPVGVYKCIYDRPDGYTYRQIIGYIAALAGKNAMIDQNGKLCFVWYNDTNAGYNQIGMDRIYEDTNDIDNITEWKIGEIKCTSIRKNADGEIYQNEYIGSDYTIGNGKIEIENPYMGDSIMQAIKSELLGFSSMKFSVKFIGDLRIRVGDILHVEMNNQEYAIPIMHVIHEWDGGVITTVESTAETDSEASVNITSPITQSIKDTKTLIINSDTAKYLNTPSESGFKTDANGNLKHKRNSEEDYFSVCDSSGSEKIKFFYENGLIYLNSDFISINHLITGTDYEYDEVQIIFPDPDSNTDVSNRRVSRIRLVDSGTTAGVYLDTYLSYDIEKKEFFIRDKLLAKEVNTNIITIGDALAVKYTDYANILDVYSIYEEGEEPALLCISCPLYVTDMIQGTVEQALKDGDGKDISDYVYEISLNDWKLKVISGNSSEKEFLLPIAGESLGGVKTTSEVKSSDGYTACPIIDGVPYYKETQQDASDVYVKKSGDTITGTLVVKNYLKVGTESGTGVELAFNTEGGNVAWYAPDKTKWEFDCYNNQFRLFNYATLKNFIISKDGNVSLPGTLTIADKLSSPLVTTTHLSGNQGQAIINSTASADSYVMLAKMNSTNGYFTHGVNKEKYELHYTAKSTVDAETNAATHTLVLMNEQGETSFPGNVFSEGDIKTTGSNKLHAGAKVRAWTDNEGGNIEIESADGINVYQMDALNGAFRIYQCVSGTPEYFPLVIKENVIKAISLELSEALKVAKKGEIGNMLVYKDTSSSMIFYIGGVGASANSYPHLKATQFSNIFQILPTVYGKNSIGHPDCPFESLVAKNVYNSSGLITSSDRNKKKDFEEIPIELTHKIIDGLIPKSFKYKAGDSGRTHYGMVAQDVEELLNKLGIDSKEFAPLVKEYPQKEVQNEDGSVSLETNYDAEPEYFLRYEGFIGLIIKYIQGLSAENTELKDRMSQMESRMAAMEEKLNSI